MIFKLYEDEEDYHEDGFHHSVVFSKFKNEWYGSEYRFNFSGYSGNKTLFSVDGNEIDIANYLLENIDKINVDNNLNLDIDYFKNRIEPDDFSIEELIEEMNTNKVKFEFLDI